MKRVFCILFLANLCSIGDSARILAIFSAPSVSHKPVFRAFINGLLERGHDVVVVTPDVDYPNGKGPANLTEINIHNISYKAIKEDMIKLKTADGTSMYNHFDELYRLVNILGDRLFRSKKFKEILTKKFDLLIVEEFHEVLLAVSNILRVPIIQMSAIGSTNSYETIGAPVNPLLYPEIITQRIKNLTFWEEIKEALAYHSLKKIQSKYERRLDDMLKRKVPHTPPLNELKNNVNKIFLNSNPIWDENRPVPIGVTYTMGIQNHKTVGLSEELKKYLDSSENGVIYISFGTDIQPSTLPADRVNITMKVLSQIPYDVLLKWDKEDIEGLPKNVKVAKWLPQIDVLKHKNIKLFITQASVQSTQEAIDAGVPLIAIPIMFDQWSNAEKIARHKIGRKIAFESVTEEELRHAIEVVVRDDSYRNNTIYLRSLLQDRRHNPLYSAVWWTDYVLKHGSSHLQSPAAGLSWIEYLELELVATLFIATILWFCIFIALCVYIFKNLRRKSSDVDLGAPYTLRFDNRKYY